VSEEDILNEARAINKLCQGSHENIVTVFNHGRFNATFPLYFIDMELCDINLEEYLLGTKSGIRGLVDRGTACKEGRHQFLILAIMQQLISGLSFIHSHDEVHRDMVLQNGNNCS